MVRTVQLKIRGMTCDHCARTIEKLLGDHGVLQKKISYPQAGGVVTFDDAKIDLETLIQRINGSEHYRVMGAQEVNPKTKPTGKKHLLIIGGGSAAFAATIQAHELGARVTMINARLPLGGTCVNVGCVPSKNLIRAAEELHRAQNPRFEGIGTKGKLSDFNKVIGQKRKLVDTLRREKYLNVIKNMKDFELIEGRAELNSPKTVEVNGQKIKADAILLATGATSFIPPIQGLKETGYLTNESAFELQSLPEHLIILGGNYIGLETAQMFSRLGSKVTVVEVQPRVLPVETADVSLAIQNYLQNEGISFYTNAQTQLIFKEGNNTVLELKHKGEKTIVKGTHLLVATGRVGNTAGLGLEKIGLKADEKGFLKVNDYLQTEIETIYAAGDVIGGNMFVYAAAYEGKLAAFNALTEKKRPKDYSALPWVVFTDPQVAGVGLNEVQAKAQGIEAETTVLEMRQVPRAIVARDTRGFIKLIRDAATDRLLGARIIAPEGGELLMELAMAVKLGLKTQELKDMFHPYLTMGEGVKLAAISFGKDVETLSCCAT